MKARKTLNINSASSLESIKKLADRSLKNGFDNQDGGGFYKGSIDGGVQDKTKIWWVQCELMVALYKLYKQEPRTDTLIKLERTWDWIKTNHLSAKIPGAWYATAKNLGDKEWNQDLGSEWFASYHTMRALIEITN